MPSDIYTTLKQEADAAWAEWDDPSVARVSVGISAAALTVGAGETLEAVRRALHTFNIKARVLEVGDIGFSWADPVVHIAPPNMPRITYGNVTVDKAADLIRDVLVNGNLRPDLALGVQGDSPIDGADIPLLNEQPWMRDQLRLLMANFGHIEPGNLMHYVARGGLESLDKALHEMSPQDVVDTVRESGLRGRGGALFPAGVKWSFMGPPGPGDRYLAINGEEGDPGAFTDAAIFENDPHRLLEGVLIASYAMGANKSYIHIRAEYRLPLERLRRALHEMEERGLVGDNIMGTGFSHEVEIEATGHAYICGEETALMESVEGHRGAPRPRPPFPAAYGIFGRPTTINNVKTISYVPTVLDMGAEEFAAVGTENASGTAMLSLSGHINKPGIAEIPVGINLAGVIENIAGGIRNGKRVKALQCGGPLGGIMPASEMDMPAEFQAMTAKGSPLGSGGILVLDEDTSIVDVVKNIAEFIDAESCGKCFPCRKGATHISRLLATMTEGYGQEGDIAKMQNVGTAMVQGSLCGLGQLAPGVLNSAIRYFREEFEEHINNRYSSTD
ncbi:MAG: NADH-quinone oxidoreductase subunit F [Dehalococcoidia bacterium]|nr:NADH-quinone oxidoreductase subunit F [Dehalococcoidia bacterium]